MKAAKQCKHLYGLRISANHCRESYFVFLRFSVLCFQFFVVTLNEEFSWISIQDCNLTSVHCSQLKVLWAVAAKTGSYIGISVPDVFDLACLFQPLVECS